MSKPAQIVMTHYGIGDAVLMTSVATALRQQTNLPVHLVCTEAQAGFASLFGGFDGCLLAATSECYTFVPCAPEAEPARGKPRWMYYADACDVTPELPPIKPLPQEVLAWAERYRGCVVLCPWATSTARTWHSDRWRELAFLFVSAGIRAVVIDQDGTEERNRHFSDWLIGLSPQKVAALMMVASCVVSNDSGMAHVAGMLRRPVVVLNEHYLGENVYGLYPGFRNVQGRLADIGAPFVFHAVMRREEPAPLAFDITPHLHTNDPWLKHEPWENILRCYDWKFRLARLIKPQSVLEIGVRYGYSAAAILAASPGCSYTGVDADNGQHGGTVGAPLWAADMLRRHFPGSMPRVLHLDTQVESPPFDARSFDLVHVDGDHSYDGCLSDLRTAARLSRRWVLVDDIGHIDDVRRATADFLARTGHDRLYFPDSLRGDCLIRVV